MDRRLRRDSPIPLYHQIAEAVRNAIAVGDLAPGDRLPAVRKAATSWDVNLHTVRKAYAELAREGLVRIDGARGTEVVRGLLPQQATDLDAFLASWVHAAGEQFGLTRIQLGQQLLRSVASSSPPAVHIIECSREQAEGHCEELMQEWHVDAKPLVLGDTSALPSGVLIGTYFHYNDIRQRWPDSLDRVRFVAIAPDPALPAVLAARRTSGPGVCTKLLVCELDEAKAVNIAADLRALFPSDDWAIEPRVLAAPGALPRTRSGTEVLVAPRVWSGLTARQRNRALQIRYRVRAHELESLGATYGWQRNRQRATA